MGSLFSALEIGKRAIHSAGLGMQTTGHNIANATTPGYSRQRVEMAAVRPIKFNQREILGLGSEVMRVSRTVNEFLETRLLNSHSNFQTHLLSEEGLQQIEAIFHEFSDTDVSTMLNEFFNRADDLAASPEDVSLRRIFVAGGQDLVDAIRNLQSRIEESRQTFNQQIPALVDNINQLLTDIRGLNSEIVAQEVGPEHIIANDLRDKRDQKLRELAQIIHIDTVEEPDGRLKIIFDEMPILDGAYQAEFRIDNSTIDRWLQLNTVIYGENPKVANPLDGKLKAWQDLRDVYAVEMMDRVNNFARSIIESVNQIHARGVGQKGLSDISSTNRVGTNVNVPLDRAILDEKGSKPFDVRNGAFYFNVINKNLNNTVTSFKINVDLDGIGSDTSLQDICNQINGTAFGLSNDVICTIQPGGELRIKVTSDNYEFYFDRDDSNFLTAMGINTFFVGTDARTMGIAALVDADPSYLAVGQSLRPGDNSNILDVAGLRNRDVSELGNITFDKYYNNTVARIGTLSLGQTRLRENREALHLSLENEREKISGVNLDEEAINLIKYQRAYQGAARYIAAVDELLLTIINGL